MAFDYAAKIAALLAKAEATPFESESAAYRAKAEELMDTYRIAEEEAIAADAEANLPIKRDLVLFEAWSDVTSYLADTFYTIARHCGIRYGASRLGYGYSVTMVGYEGDVRYAEFLYSAARLMFSTKIDPRWDSTLPETENIYRMRQAGMKRKDIADAAGWDGTVASARSKVQRIYLKEVSTRGEDALASGLDFNSQTYRKAYADAFVTTLTRRLREARDAADSVSGGLVLHGRSDRVDEAFYQAFPNRRPSTDPMPVPEPCLRCVKNGGHCRQHPEYKWTKADQARWERDQYSSSAQAGRGAGASAAAGVVIARGHSTAQRVEASGQAIGN